MGLMTLLKTRTNVTIHAMVVCLFLIVLMPLMAKAEAPMPKGVETIMNVSINGTDRQALVYIPNVISAQTKRPLVIALHGGGGDMTYMARDELYGLKSKADQAGFIVIFPNGTGALGGTKLATWNAGNCCGKARDSHVDDVAFVRAVVKKAIAEHGVDPERVYATGMSNGGMMAYRLACDAADVFKAIAAVAGTDNTQSCAPSRPVAILHIHALNDDHVQYNGGAGPASVRRAAITDYRSVDATIAKWVGLNHASTTPEEVLNVPGAKCWLYKAIKVYEPVKLCQTEVGGHSWPGGTKRRGEAPSQAIRANDIMWDFFTNN